jgi:hypothetical protein
MTRFSFCAIVAVALAGMASAKPKAMPSFLRESQGARGLSDYESGTKSSGSESEKKYSDDDCSCDYVTTEMCQECYGSGEYDDCCDFDECCDVNEHDDDKWGGSSGGSWGGSSGGSWGGSSGGGGSKSKPKLHPKSSSSKSKPKPHPKSKHSSSSSSSSSGSSSGSSSSSNSGGKWSAGGGWGGRTASPTASPTSSPTYGGCVCDIFSDESCADCFEGSGKCPDKECAGECCQVKECECDVYDSDTCNVCLGDGDGSCPDGDCAIVCCTGYDEDGSSSQPKTAAGYTMSYSAKSSMNVGNSGNYMYFSIFAMIVGSAMAAVAFSSRRSSSSLEASEPLTGVQDMDNEGPVSRIVRKRRALPRGVEEQGIEIMDGFGLGSRSYVQPVFEKSEVTAESEMEVPEVLEAAEIGEAEEIVVEAFDEEETTEQLVDLDESSPAELNEQEEYLEGMAMFESS